MSLDSTEPDLRRPDARNPTDGMTRLLGYRPPLARVQLACGSQITRRWTREGFDGYAGGMPGILVATYHDREQSCAWTCEGRRLAATLVRDTVTLIPEGRDGTWRLGGRIDVSQIYLTSERLAQCAAEAGYHARFELLNRVGYRDPVGAQILRTLTADNALAEPAMLLFVDRALDMLCLQLIGSHSSIGGTSHSPARGGLADWQFRRVTSYMRDNLSHVIRLDDLAGLVGLSRFHFCTSFGKTAGVSPGAWLARARIGRACEMLQDTSLPVGEIASAVGYATLPAFGAAFRRAVGTSPSEYRKRR